MAKTALITRITGQDGAYLAELANLVKVVVEFNLESLKCK
jgi:GDP-D-mannose dehydratase